MGQLEIGGNWTSSLSGQKVLGKGEGAARDGRMLAGLRRAGRA